MTAHEIEALEEKYLNKFYHLFKCYEDEILDGFKAQKDIISTAVSKSENMINALFSKKKNRWELQSGIIEAGDAQIHIYKKSAQASNISDQNESLPMGKTQNSYHGTIVKERGRDSEEYRPSLPAFTDDGRPILVYFLSMLYDKESLDVLVISLLSMPNGELGAIYGNAPLKAGKNLGQACFCFSKTPQFSTFAQPDDHSRAKVVYFKKDMPADCLEKLKFYRGIAQAQGC